MGLQPNITDSLFTKATHKNPTQRLLLKHKKMFWTKTVIVKFKYFCRIIIEAIKKPLP